MEGPDARQQDTPWRCTEDVRVETIGGDTLEGYYPEELLIPWE